MSLALTTASELGSSSFVNRCAVFDEQSGIQRFDIAYSIRGRILISQGSLEAPVKSAVLGAGDDLFLQLGGKIAEIVAIAGDADDEVAVLLRAGPAPCAGSRR